MKHVFVLVIAAMALLTTASLRAASHLPAIENKPSELVIKITAKRFVFTPDSITVKKGQPVVLEITSADVPHGFTLPDFNVRTDVSPGKISRIHFTPNKTGEFTFACDVFCGSGHEDMSGTLKVTE